MIDVLIINQRKIKAHGLRLDHYIAMRALDAYCRFSKTKLIDGVSMYALDYDRVVSLVSYLGVDLFSFKKVFDSLNVLGYVFVKQRGNNTNFMLTDKFKEVI